MILNYACSPPNLSEVAKLVERFAPIGLAEMEGVRLLNRTDTKFMLPLSSLFYLLDQLRDSYRILTIEGNRLNEYETLYFDTPDLQCYHDHQTGRLNRYKIRQRRYVASNLLFTEVKHKTNKGRTVKRRFQNSLSGPLTTAGVDGSRLDEESQQFVSQQVPLNCSALHPMLWVGYQRITLVNRSFSERLTLDLNLMFQNNSRQQRFSSMVIAEVKQDARHPSTFLDLMKQNGYRRGAISKYCLGMISLYQPIRHNRFKPKLIRLQKILSQ